jgi:hypothetical protein
MMRSDATTRHFVLRSIPAAARETGVPEATLHRWVDDRSLSAVPLGRATVVNMLEVEALRARAVPDLGPPGGDGPARDRPGPRLLRLVGATNAATGAAGALAFAGLGPGDLASPRWLALCAASVAVGVLELRGLPRRRGRGSASG